MADQSAESCVFCAIARHEAHADIVHEDELTVSFVDLRQFNPGHVLVIPRAHLADLRELDDVTGAALVASIVRITRAVGRALPNEGISLWHSIGPAAYQEVPHLHVHVHPRRTDDGCIRIYPRDPLTSPAGQRSRIAALVKAAL